jgi:membrane peptidoglycan carboxypeptidase
MALSPPAGDDPGPAPADDVLPQGVARRRLPRRRTVAVALLVPSALAVLGLGVLFATVDVPRPETLANPQVSLITYRSGEELGRVGAQNRVEVPLSRVSEAARLAVLSAENRDYYSEPGISPKGIVRAALANVRGGGVKQGASTITQQYAKNAYLTQERTVSRKLKEVVIAVKLDRSYSKDEVLEFYLNTVYFGRGAYGVEVAAQTYFGKPAAELSAAEGAVLAALLRSPSAYDPADDPKDARERWEYVVRGMQEEGWLEGAAPAYPTVLPKPEGDVLGGPEGYLVRQVQDELEALGFPEARIRSGGLRVVTTLDRRAQAAAVESVHAVTGEDLPEGVHRALVAVEPGTGRIRAEYAGTDYVARPFNSATQGVAQAGSSFKPYVLAAALDSRMSLRTKMNGASPQTFGDYEVSNYGDEQFGDIDLVQATAHSVNTVYVPLAEKAGLHTVSDVARRLGVTANMSKEDDLPSFSLGVTAVTPLEQAVAYASLAARGTHATPYLVEEVLDPDGRVLHRAQSRTRQALSEGVADDTTFALQSVVNAGTGKGARLPGRPAAGKTGTTTGNTAAWFVGYTPQLATAVALFSERQDVPLRGIAGVGEVTGGSLPARTWSRFMTAALEGQPVKQFAPPVYGGSEPTPSASPSPSGSPSPSPSPSVSPSPSPSLSPSPAASPAGAASPYSWGSPYAPPPDRDPPQKSSPQPASPAPYASPTQQTTTTKSGRSSSPSPSPSASTG